MQYVLASEDPDHASWARGTDRPWGLSNAWGWDQAKSKKGRGAWRTELSAALKSFTGKGSPAKKLAELPTRILQGLGGQGWIGAGFQTLVFLAGWS